MCSGLSRRVAVGLLVTGIAAGCSKENADTHLRKADQYLADSKLNEAVLEYRTAIQQAPRRGDIRAKLAEALVLSQDPAAALKEYVRAADLLPNDAAAQVKAGSLLLVAGAFEDAKARAEKALALEPKNTSAQILRGNALAGLKDLQAALSEYQEVAALNPSATAYGNIGAIQQARGNLKEAEASFRKAIETTPTSLEARMALAGLLWSSKRLDEAERSLKDAVAIAPTNDVVNRTLGVFYLANNRAAEAEPYFQAIVKSRKTIASSLSLADYYVAAKRYDQARKILNDLLSDEKAHTAAMIRLAGVAAAQGDRALAASTLREILDQRPKEVTARLLFARLLLSDGKRDEALAQATSIVAEQPNSVVTGDAYVLMAGIYAAKDRSQEAIRAYEEAVKRQTRPLEASLALANLYLSAGDLEKARTYAEQALAIQQNDGQARLVMMLIALERKDLSDARDRLVALQKDYPNTPGVLYLEGELRSAEGHTETARAAFQKATALAPADPQMAAALVRLDLAAGHKREAVSRVESLLKTQHTADVLLVAARTYAAIGDRDKTEEMLIQAIAADPGRRQPYALLGAFYLGQKRLPEARDRFKQAVENDPKSIVANTVLAMIFELQHQTAEAEKQYKAALAVDPRAPIAANNLAWMYASANRNLDEALQLAQDAQRSAPNDPEVNDTLGWVYYNKKMFADAVRCLEESAQTRTRDASVQYHLGMAYMQTGDFVKAKASLQRALSLQSDFEGAAEARSALTRVGG